jgi:hypothetical protein
MKKNILAIGAYERDNFGDLLFFLTLKLALAKRECNLVASSIVSSDMRETLGEYVFPYHFLLSDYKWDAIWIVGGEMGGLDLTGALSMSLSGIDYFKLSESGRMIVNKYLVGKDFRHLAYLPEISNYSKNKDAMLVINSVGGFEALSQDECSKLLESTKETLMDAAKICVRNKQSHEYLNSLGIKNNLLPDVVHAIATYYEGDKFSGEGYIIFQINVHLLEKYSIENVSEQIYNLIFKYGYKVCLFAAGTAKYHDSFTCYEKIKEHVKDKYKEERVDIIYERNPLALVDWIKNAKITIGSSLHLRIVSAAFAVPRVSLKVEKMTKYCQIWDDGQPYDIELENILQACNVAFAVKMEGMFKHAEALRISASENIEAIIEKIYENR